MRVRDAMTQNPATCGPDATLQDVARLMEDQDCGAVPVIDKSSGKPIGIITDRDIACRAVAHGKDPKSTKVRDCMSNALITVEPDMDLDECCKTMEAEQVRRMPVVDQQGCCCGIIAQADIARRGDEHETAEVVRDVSRPSSRGIWAHTVP